MEQTQLSNADILNLAKALLDNDPIVIGNCVSHFRISCEEIERTELSKTECVGSKPTVSYRKRIAAVKKRLRKAISEICKKKGLCSKGKNIPTSELVFEDFSPDGYLIGENLKHRTLVFFDPLTKGFLSIVEQYT